MVFKFGEIAALHRDTMLLRGGPFLLVWHDWTLYCTIRTVTRAASYECSTEFFIAFRSNTFQFLSAHTNTFEFIEDSGEMNRDEAVGSCEADELIKEVVGVAMNKLWEVFDVFTFQTTHTHTNSTQMIW
ncbi:hypothetical protein K503DRAFT_282148 [Rhizopogon vinicolor AM-OR11-026]|uniref:Uncharacterized protein n=1 Tax=Rhizopogon vinicolor AM-OR11-026 TaxID=1314800 RepID=A0A1B7MVR6_9AGAM|nr:hypothetical protein K503DRAFT_282148 [Rhizopogon vinicolor AM-OR11-026]